MKILLIIGLLASSTVFAQDTTSCKPEAQIIAEVASHSTNSLTYCRVKIDAKSIKMYNVNQLCPLDLAEVLAREVSVGLVNGHDCAVGAGDTISGVLVQLPNGTIYLE